MEFKNLTDKFTKTTCEIQKCSDVAKLFDEVWKENKYKGFSHRTAGENKTPFLNQFIGQLPIDARVVELGAGSFDHAFRMAKENNIIKEVLAIEYSQTAVNDAKERATHLDEHIRSRLTIQCNDLFKCLNQMKENSLQGIYANSVFHFLTKEQREQAYKQSFKILSAGGVIGVSFKFQGDALFKSGEFVEQTDAGIILCDKIDHINRLFVSPTGVDVLADELQSVGFNVDSIIRWSVPNYNIEGDNGLFVGFIAKR
ncbi:hypothetical protein I4U23_004133 [Adineta vaga]|nr:hypothetical protein I4U23_004133 [Adineta vaga]